MLPSQTQRVLMLLAVVIGVPMWWWAVEVLQPADGLGGWVLRDASGGVAGGLGIVLLAALPAVLAGGIVAAAGNPIAGVLCVALSTVVGWWGTAFDGVAVRAVDAGGGGTLYLSLGLELLAWFGLLGAMLLALQWMHLAWRGKLSHRLTSRHLGGKVDLRYVEGKSVTAGLITMGVGFALSLALVRSTDPGQVVGGLVLGFALAALVGHAVSPNERPGVVLAAPLGVGAVGYAWAGWKVAAAAGSGTGSAGELHGGAFPGAGEALLRLLYEGALPGPALALPMHYATAGVVGCVIGIGIGQVLEHAKLGE